MSIYQIISLALSIAFLCCSAFVSASEVAFFALTPADLDDFRQSDSKAARRVLQLLDIPERLLATILIANNFVNIAIIILLTYLTNSLLDFSQSPLLAFLVETVLITFILLVFGEIMPKIYSNQNARRMALRAALPMQALVALFAPLGKVLVKSTAIVGSAKAHAHSDLSMEQIGEALSLTADTPEQDKDMLEGIIKFGNIAVSDIMCPRVDIVDIDTKAPYREVLRTIVESGYSRIPVYSGTNDNIKGVLYSKDLLQHIDKGDNFRWQSLVRPAYFVPEAKKIDDLLREFQENKVHLAIVVDEYGGTAGLVTMEDILEEIVGDINDEYDDEEPNYKKIDDHTYVFEGKTLLTDFFRWTEIEEEDLGDAADEAETLAGLVLELKGEIPKRGEKITYRNFTFEVVAADKRRIKQIKVTF